MLSLFYGLWTVRCDTLADVENSLPMTAAALVLSDGLT